MSGFKIYKTTGTEDYVPKIETTLQSNEKLYVDFSVLARDKASLVFYAGDDPHKSWAYLVTIDECGGKHRAAISRRDKNISNICGNTNIQKDVRRIN